MAELAVSHFVEAEADGAHDLTRLQRPLEESVLPILVDAELRWQLRRDTCRVGNELGHFHLLVDMGFHWPVELAYRGGALDHRGAELEDHVVVVVPDESRVVRIE